MSKSPEEAKLIYENIDAELEKLYTPDVPVEFSSDPETARLQKIVLYYLIKRSTFASTADHAEKEAKFQDMARSVTDKTDPVYICLADIAPENRFPFLNDLIVSDGSFSSLNSFYIDVAELKSEVTPAKATAENIYSRLFYPLPDDPEASKNVVASGLNTVFEGRHSEEIAKTHAAIDSVRIKGGAVPASLSSEDISLSVFGSFLSDELMEKQYKMSLSSKGSTLRTELELAGAGRAMVFENMFKNDARLNMHLARHVVPEAWEKTKRGLEDYALGNKTPFAESLKECVLRCAEFCKYTAKPADFTYGYPAEKMLKALNVLEREEFKNLVSFTDEEKEMIDSVKKETELNREFTSLTKDVSEGMLNHYFDAYQNPMNDPALCEKVTRLLTLRCHASLSYSMMSDESDIASGRNTLEELDSIRTNRKLSLCEKLALNRPEKYFNTLKENVLKSDIFKNLQNAQSPNAFLNALKAGINYDFAGDIGTLNISRFENIRTQDTVKADIASLPDECADLKARMSALSCMNADNPLPEQPTAAQLQSRINEYRSVLDYIGREYPDGYSVIQHDDRLDLDLQVDLIDPIISDFEKTIDRLTLAKNNLPFSLDIRTNAAVSEYMEGLKKKEQSGIVTGRFYDKKGSPVEFDAAEQMLIRGEKLRLATFEGSNYAGAIRDISFSGSSVPVEGVKTLATRVSDVSSGIKNADEQLAALKEFREVLKTTDKFYVSNSSEFNKAMRTLNEVIRAQENIGKDPNIRQIATLGGLYEKLSTDIEAYTSKKTEKLKVGDERGQRRLETMTSLSKITGAVHFNKIAAETYPERRALGLQTSEISETVSIIKKWADGPVTDPAAFKKDFDKVAEKIDSMGSDKLYANIAVYFVIDKLDKFVDLRTSIKGTHPVSENEQARIDRVKSFMKECPKSIEKYTSMSPDIKPPVRKAPVKTINPITKA